MMVKDLMVDLEKGDRTKEMLKISSVKKMSNVDLWVSSGFPQAIEYQQYVLQQQLNQQQLPQYLQDNSRWFAAQTSNQTSWR